jgi:hypothetical protein
MRLESPSCLAWVDPVYAGLLDCSLRVPDAPPRPLLTRAPAEIDDPAWLAARFVFESPPTPTAWEILDRTPLSARLAARPSSGMNLAIRFELTAAGLLIELDAAFAQPLPLQGRFLAHGLGPGVSLDPHRGFGRVECKGSESAANFSLAPATSHALSISLCPGALP